MNKTKEELIEELKRKTDHLGPWGKVVYGFVSWIKSVLELTYIIIRIATIFLFAIVKFLLKIFLFLAMLFFIFNFTDFLMGDSSNLQDQFDLLNPMVIISASLAALCIAFYNVIQHEDINEEKKNILRNASEGFFWSTLWYVFAIIFGVLRNFNENFVTRYIPIEILQTIFIYCFFLCTVIATFYLSIQIYNIMTNVGSFYEKPKTKKKN